MGLWPLQATKVRAPRLATSPGFPYGASPMTLRRVDNLFLAIIALLTLAVANADAKSARVLIITPHVDAIRHEHDKPAG